MERESLEWSVVSATLAPFAIPPAAQPQPVDVAAKFNVDPVAGERTTLKGTALDQIGDYTVTVKAKATCEWNVNGKMEMAEAEDTITVVFHVYTVFLGVHAKDFKQDDDFVMLKDDIGEMKGGKIDKHENVYPFLEQCFATVLGNPTAVPVRTFLSNISKHYTFQAVGPVNADGTIDVPKLPAWREYAIRGIKRSEKVDDVVQEGTFAGKKAKDQGTVFWLKGKVALADTAPYVVTRDKLFEYIDVPDPLVDLGFVVSTRAQVMPDDNRTCSAPQAKVWWIGYVQNVTALTLVNNYLPNTDSADFDDAIPGGTTIMISGFYKTTLPFPAALRDKLATATMTYDDLISRPINCGGIENSSDDTPLAAAGILASRIFPAPEDLVPPPAFGVKVDYRLDHQQQLSTFLGWCVAYKLDDDAIVPLHQLEIQLDQDNKLKKIEARVSKVADTPSTPPITDGETANEYRKRTGLKEVDGPANTKVTKPREVKP